jgi:hypothetical protein
VNPGPVECEVGVLGLLCDIQRNRLQSVPTNRMQKRDILLKNSVIKSGFIHDLSGIQTHYNSVRAITTNAPDRAATATGTFNLHYAVKILNYTQKQTFLKCQGKLRSQMDC